MERRRFFAGLFLMVGLVLGSLFTNFVYKDYLAYGGQIDSLVLNNKDLYVSSASLLPYILFKRISAPAGSVFVWQFLLRSLFLGIYVIAPDHTDGTERTYYCLIQFFSSFYLLWRGCASFVSKKHGGK